MNEKNSLKSQGAIEYLIIIGTVITIAAVAMVIVSGALGQRQEEILYDQCSSAASRCNTRRALNPEAACRWCEKQCVDNDGNPLFGEEDEINAIDCCMLGLDDEIFLGAGADGEYEENCEPTLEPDFTYSISGLEVYFTDQSRFSPYHPDYEITGWEWSDDEGELDSSEQNPSVNYSSEGVYNVTLKVDGENQETGETHSGEITKMIEWEGFFINSLAVKQSEIYEGENITVQAVIENAGDESESQEVTLESDLWTDSKSLTLDGGDTEEIDFNYQTSRTERGNYTATVKTEDDSETLDFRIKGNYSVEFSSDSKGEIVVPGEGIFYYLEGGPDIEIGAQAYDQAEFNKGDDLDIGASFGATDRQNYYTEMANVSEASELDIEGTYNITDAGSDCELGLIVQVTGSNIDKEFKWTESSSGVYTENETINVYGVEEVEVNYTAYADSGDETVIEGVVKGAMHYPDEPGPCDFDEWKGSNGSLVDINSRETNITAVEDDLYLEATFTGN